MFKLEATDGTTKTTIVNVKGLDEAIDLAGDFDYIITCQCTGEIAASRSTNKNGTSEEYLDWSCMNCDPDGVEEDLEDATYPDEDEEVDEDSSKWEELFNLAEEYAKMSADIWDDYLNELYDKAF